jgi:hypothetical protein
LDLEQFLWFCIRSMPFLSYWSTIYHSYIASLLHEMSTCIATEENKLLTD